MAERDELTESLFRQIDACADDTVKDDLIGEVVALNMPVAEALAHRYHGRGENDEDLTQVAYLGLIKAARGFSAERGHHFLAYAVPTITGELKRHFRDKCWTVRPPRRIQDLQRDIAAARHDLGQDLGRQPSTDEVARQVEASGEEVTEAMASRGCFTPGSLDAPAGPSTSTTVGDHLPADDHEHERVETKVLLDSVVDQLDSDEQEMLRLRFFEEWTQQQIADKFGTSQMQISRRLSRLMQQLRTMIGETSHAA